MHLCGPGVRRPRVGESGSLRLRRTEARRAALLKCRQLVSRRARCLGQVPAHPGVTAPPPASPAPPRVAGRSFHIFPPPAPAPPERPPRRGGGEITPNVGFTLDDLSLT